MARGEILHRAWLWRFCPSLAGLLLYLLFVALWRAAPHAYAALLWAADAMPQLPMPFNDLGAVLQADACWRHGVNVYAPSPCMHGGVYNYSPFLLHLARVAPSSRALMRGGVALGVVFLIALSALPAPRTRAELALRLISTCSGSVIFALERANIDVAMFLLTLLGISLLRARSWVSLLGYAVFAFAAACKFYPAVLLALAARERRVRLLSVAVCVICLGLLYLLVFAHGTLTAIDILPVGLPFAGIFGAMDIPFGLVLLHSMREWTLQPDAAQYLAAMAHPGAIPIIKLAQWALILAGLAAGIKTAPRYAYCLDQLDEARRLPLLGGALVMVFCFYATQNIPYRAIFFLLTLPGLAAMAATAQGRTRRIILSISYGIGFLLWQDALRNLVATIARWLLPPRMVFYPEFIFWLSFECLWWWVIVQFTGVLVCFLRAAMDGLRWYAHE